MKATIKMVSKYGGLLLEGKGDKEWFNPPKEEKELQGMIYETYKKGDRVILTMDSEHIFRAIEKDESELEQKSEQKLETEKPKIAGYEQINQELKKTTFNILNTKSVEIEKKGNLNYSSWAELWTELKKEYNEANFIIHEWDGIPYLKTSEGVFVKVSVTIKDLTHTIFLPVMDFKNQSIKEPDAMQINKTIMRCLAKTISLHGLGLYLYRGEDINEC
jgi:hypothetical protein